MTIREEAVVNALMGAFFEYPQVQRVMKRLEWTRKFGRNQFGSYDGMMLIGDTRTGKTRLLEAYRDQFGPYIDRGKRVVRRPQRVLVIEMPRPCTLKGVCFAIYDHFGLDVAQRTNTVILVNDTMDLLRSIGVELLCLDEAHHMFRLDSIDHLAEVADFIKTLLNQRVCSIVLVGMPELKTLCENNAQLNERLIYKMALRAYQWPAGDEKPGSKALRDEHEFRFILDTFEAQLPFEPIGLGKIRELAFRIWSATQGRPGSAAALIKSAAIRTLGENAERLSLAAFEEAYEDAHGFDGHAGNPFALYVDDDQADPDEAEELPIDENSLSGLRKGKGRRPNVKEMFHG